MLMCVQKAPTTVLSLRVFSVQRLSLPPCSAAQHTPCLLFNSLPEARLSVQLYELNTLSFAGAVLFPSMVRSPDPRLVRVSVPLCVCVFSSFPHCSSQVQVPGTMQGHSSSLYSVMTAPYFGDLDDLKHAMSSCRCIPGVYPL